MLTPFEYQLAGVEGLRAGFRAGKRRGLLVMLMGGGKTVLSFIMQRGAQEKTIRSLFLCDRRMLADQALDRARDEELDAAILMAGRGRDLEALCQFASKQSVTSWLAKGTLTLPDFGLIIIDEAHRAVSEAYQALIRRWPNAFIVGLTATPCLGNGSGMGAYYDFLVQPILPSGLRTMGRTVPVRAFAPHVPKLDGVKTGHDGDYAKAALTGLMTRENMIGDIPGWWKKLAPGRASIYFCCDKAHALAVRDQFRAEGISADLICDDTPDEERDDIKRRLENGELLIAVTVDVLAEGIDWPFISCIGLVRPTKRLRRFLQMVGRGLRAFAGKADCILIDHSGAVIYHGPPDADRDWPLAVTDNADKINQAKRKDEPATMICAKCQAILVGTRKCPECGHVHLWQKAPRDLGGRNGTLIEVTDDLPPQTRDLLHQRFWGTCIGVAVKRRAKAAVAAGMFSNKFGIPPWQAGVKPLPARINGIWQRPASEVFPGFARGGR